MSEQETTLKEGTINVEEVIGDINSTAGEFINGLRSWSTRKKKMIENIAENFRELIDHKIVYKTGNGNEVIDFGTYTHRNICGLVCDKLEEYNVPATAFGYVRHILSKKNYTDASVYQQIRAASKSFDFDYGDEMEELATHDFTKFDYIPRDQYANLPIEEKIRIKKQFLAKDKERKSRSRENRTMMDDELMKEGINPDSIKESNIESPPPSMWHKSKASLRMGQAAERTQRLTDIFTDSQALFERFPPDEELDNRVDERMAPFIEVIFDLLIDFFSGYPDQKNAYTWPQWFDKLLAEFYTIETPEIVRRSLLTGEFATMDNDGKEVIIPLERKITNKHVKDRLEELEVEVRKMPLFAMLFSGLELYVRNQKTIIGDSAEIAKIEEAYKKANRTSPEYTLSEEQESEKKKIEQITQ